MNFLLISWVHTVCLVKTLILNISYSENGLTIMKNLWIGVDFFPKLLDWLISQSD